MSRPWTTALAATLLALLPAPPAGGQQRPESGGGRAVEVRVIEHDEFRWGDAGIGALAGAGLVAIGAGLFVATDRRRRSMS